MTHKKEKRKKEVCIDSVERKDVDVKNVENKHFGNGKNAVVDGKQTGGAVPLVVGVERTGCDEELFAVGEESGAKRGLVDE